MSSDIVRSARYRAGLTQEELARRSGYPRTTIARWETGAREPSLATLRRVVAACGLDLVIRLAEGDDSLDQLVGDQLRLSPLERLERLLPGDEAAASRRALGWLGDARTPAVLIGAVAGALQGAPQRPGDGRLEAVPSDPVAFAAELTGAGFAPSDDPERWAEMDRRWPWRAPDGGVIAVATRLPGSRDYPDLRRSARPVALDEATSVLAAHPRDLLRLADASPRETERAQAPGLRALLERLAVS